MADFIRKINELPIAASQAAPSSTLATNLGKKIDTVTPSGSGAVVTSVTKSGNTGLAVTLGDISIDDLSNWATETDVAISGTTYHTWWPVAPTSSNQVFGISIGPTGKLVRIYNNKGAYSAQNYDSNTTYSTLTQSQVDTGTETTGKLVTAKIIHDSIKKWSLEKLENPNFDNITVPGMYNVQITQACTGAPPGLGSMGSCILIVNAVEDDVVMSQTAIMLNGRTCSRGRSGDGTWDDFWANRESRGVAEATDAHAEGDSARAYGNNSHAEGYNTRASGASTHAEGNGSQATSGQAHAEGYSTEASGSSSHAEGTSTKSIGTQSHAEGYGGKAEGDSSHVEGSLCISGGVSAHAEGGATVAAGKDSHAEGYSDGAIEAELASPTNAGSGTFVTTTNVTTGDKNWISVPSISFASRIVASAGSRSFTVTDSVLSTVAAGTKIFFVAHGALGQGSHVEGYRTLATNQYAHAEGYETQATGYVSHAEGFGTQASGSRAHAEGHDTTASGDFSHAEGFQTKATSLYSHAEGDDTTASGKYSHAEGLGTAAQSDGMHAAGIYNATKSGYARITGWGTYEQPKDIEKLDTSGNLTLAGNIYANGNKQVSVSGHTHSAGDITSGTLPLSRGGTGQTSAINATNSLLTSLDTGSDDVWNTDLIIASNHSNNATDTTKFVKRTAEKLWNYIKSKLSDGSDKQIKTTYNSGGGFLAEHGTSGQWIGYLARRTDTGVAVDIEVGGQGVNHGIWSNQLNSGSGGWMIYATQDGKNVYFNGILQGMLNLNNSDGIASISNGGTAGGTLTVGALRLTGTGTGSHKTVIDKSSSFTVSTSDVNNCANGQIFIYRNTSTSPLTVTWTYKSGTTASGTVYVGCSAMFYLVHKTNGYFTRIA